MFFVLKKEIAIKWYRNVKNDDSKDKIQSIVIELFRLAHSAIERVKYHFYSVFKRNLLT